MLPRTQRFLIIGGWGEVNKAISNGQDSENIPYNYLTLSHTQSLII